MKEKVLLLLKEGEYISGEKLSEILGVSRTAVWKAINSLRDDGYEIDSVTNKGYKLVKKPNVLNASTISEGLNVKVVGTEIITLKTVDSTNEEIKRKAHENARSGLVVISCEQTAGKGRLGRKWASNEGGVYFSFLLRPELPPSDVSGITLAAGLGVCLAIRKFTGLDAKIKWPNDVIVGNKKICGILTEMTAQTDMVDFVVIGIGINVLQESFPEEIAYKATSLKIETKSEPDLSELMHEIIATLDKTILSYLFGISQDDLKLYKSMCATIGREVSLVRNGEKLTGKAVDITADGELVVCLENGKKIAVNSGEVTVQGIY